MPLEKYLLSGFVVKKKYNYVLEDEFNIRYSFLKRLGSDSKVKYFVIAQTGDIFLNW